MAQHDEYGKAVLLAAVGSEFCDWNIDVGVDYGAGNPARIDATVAKIVAVEVESRVAKQVRGAVLDLICHSFPKKLLVLLPVHMNNPEVTATQCRNIMKRFLEEPSFRVIVLSGSGFHNSIEEDVKLVRMALAELGVNKAG